MHVVIDVAGGDQTVALYNWLRRDPGIARRVTVTGRASADPTAMAALDVIDVVLTHVTGIGTLALALLAWRQSHPAAGPVRITRPDGRMLTIDGDAAMTADVLVAFLSGNEPAGGPGTGREHPAAERIADAHRR